MSRDYAIATCRPPGTRVEYPHAHAAELANIAILSCNVPTEHLMLSLAYNMLLVGACTAYAYRTRKIPENFNETKYIGFTMYATCIIWLAFVPIYFATRHEFRIQITSLSACVSFSGTVALGCFFAPKVYIVLYQPYKNVRNYRQKGAVSNLFNQQMNLIRSVLLSAAACQSGRVNGLTVPAAKWRRRTR